VPTIRLLAYYYYYHYYFLNDKKPSNIFILVVRSFGFGLVPQFLAVSFSPMVPVDVVQPGENGLAHRPHGRQPVPTSTAA